MPLVEISDTLHNVQMPLVEISDTPRNIQMLLVEISDTLRNVQMLLVEISDTLHNVQMPVMNFWQGPIVKNGNNSVLIKAGKYLGLYMVKDRLTRSETNRLVPFLVFRHPMHGFIFIQHLLSFQ